MKLKKNIKPYKNKNETANATGQTASFKSGAGMNKVIKKLD